MKALILVDLQIDFSPMGALPVVEGDQVVAVANEMMDQFDYVVASKDWHPADHLSFAANHPWRKPGQVIELGGLPQTLWPIHCVQNSFGAHFIPGLQEEKIDHMVYKGTDKQMDSYSCFYDNHHQQSTGLAEHLREQQVKTVYIMGLATDYCVLFSALDAIEEGFETYLIEKGCRGVNLEEGDAERAVLQMREKGVKII